MKFLILRPLLSEDAVLAPYFAENVSMNSTEILRIKRVLRAIVVMALTLTWSNVGMAQRTSGGPQVPIPTTAAQVPGPAPGTAMTKEYVQMVGRIAYF